MHHSTLGTIERDNDGDGRAQISYESRAVSVFLSPADVSFEECVELAARVIQNLQELDSLAKRVAASELTDTYNGGWNEHDQVQEDGSMKTVTNPELSQSEFAGKLTLAGISVTGSEGLDLTYENENMFWGHSVIVCSSSGTDLSGATAELFG